MELHIELEFRIYSKKGGISMRVRTGEVEVLAKIPGVGFLEGPSYCPEDGFLYFVEIRSRLDFARLHGRQIRAVL